MPSRPGQDGHDQEPISGAVHQGHISPVLVAADYSSIPEQARVAVWSDDGTYPVGSKGRSVSDTETNTDVAIAIVGGP